MNGDTSAVWGVHTGRPRGQSNDIHKHLEQETDRLFRQGHIAHGCPQMGDLRAIELARDAFKHQYRSTYGQDAPPRSMGADTGMLFQFVHCIQVGDIVAWRSLVDGLLHLGRVTGPYRYDPTLNAEYHHLRPVEWVTAFPTSDLSDETRNQLKMPRSLFRIKNPNAVAEYRGAVTA
jgi:restriction system protein